MKIRSRLGWKNLFLFCLALSIASSAQSFQVLVELDGSNGSRPDGSFIQGLDGNLYGTTENGGVGAFQSGTIFSITPQGKLMTLYSCASEVCPSPVGALAQTKSGALRGTAIGNASPGVIYKVMPEGTETTLYRFCSKANCADGENPVGGVVLATDGNFYGVTLEGGAGNLGTVFKITPDGELTTLHSFDGSDGAFPYGGLLQATDGNFYGTTPSGGTGDGTVFKITPQGVLTTLYSFCAQPNCTDGVGPEAGLVQAPGGNFYGTTQFGGSGCSAPGCGTAFEITPEGNLTTLYSFCALAGCLDGSQPSATLVLATDGKLYGTTQFGGSSNSGTLFQITLAGALLTLEDFGGSDGVYPLASLFQATNGVLYGTTATGGTSNDGTIFALALDVGPFVETLPRSGSVGKTIDILSQGLTGTTAVSFNGTAASFTIVSDTYLTATVPSGATTGFVTVSIPGKTLKSNQKFRVTP
jgi:uncharacterized repeat protein (TIGR03803 family)